ncbi:MAG: hypothetical protein D6748_00400 [Calditrichaeota bacterium]|nr:MAG: hypothetical protein D6748_00400 [Calditrichota bacterium]
MSYFARPILERGQINNRGPKILFYFSFLNPFTESHFSLEETHIFRVKVGRNFFGIPGEGEVVMRNIMQEGAMP